MMKLEDIPKPSFAHFFPLTLDTWVRFQVSHGHKSSGTGFFSEDIGFTLPVSFHHYSIPIHLTITDAELS
jgi:hypothetical protein